uniref:Uncharacterized protein n=1 Tax=Salix viminalis TaxID=40686 RepID=A0A6N2LEL0_SALVM
MFQRNSGKYISLRFLAVVKQQLDYDILDKLVEKQRPENCSFVTDFYQEMLSKCANMTLQEGSYWTTEEWLSALLTSSSRVEPLPIGGMTTCWGTKKDKKVNEETAFIRNGSKLLEKLVDICDGKCNSIRRFSATELEKATNNYDPLKLLTEDSGYKLIVLDEFQTVLHSPGSIASVGVIHPLAFHLENKETTISLSNNDKANYSSPEKKGSVFEVQGDCPQRSETTCQSNAERNNLVEVRDDIIYISRTKKDNIFSICCWLQDSCKNSAGSHEDLAIALKHIESQLTGYGFGWGHVLYIHLYIADMNEFAMVNETYVRFITQEKCPFGVPSRSTIELPLLQASLGKAYIEVLLFTELVA